MNTLRVLAPYRYKGTWVFDDANAGLTREPFVAGTDKMIDEITKNIHDAGNGFTLIFSNHEFPGFTHRLDWRRPELGGNVYYSEKLDMEGWLCPALGKYFLNPPKHIYVKV